MYNSKGGIITAGRSTWLNKEARTTVRLLAATASHLIRTSKIFHSSLLSFSRSNSNEPKWHRSQCYRQKRKLMRCAQVSIVKQRCVRCAESRKYSHSSFHLKRKAVHEILEPDFGRLCVCFCTEVSTPLFRLFGALSQYYSLPLSCDPGVAPDRPPQMAINWHQNQILIDIKAPYYLGSSLV
jgi:hypothetical protein